ncbi:uncharacterized protein LOC133920508 [Phragmites australis]|uniref:uncharacterized protein LOC133920508 n=1 Tax=Phragmites australis TaxID=29695 RepID=UPI002D770001|nr:uncharacterized protein LOC133920508 [Phragmites australis]
MASYAYIPIHIRAQLIIIPSIDLDLMASPGSNDDGAAAAAAVCCMCGDHGLPSELFRCSLCRLRLQHRYCSDLYPVAAGSYRRCNWCLREKGGGDLPVKAPMAAAKQSHLNISRDDDGDEVRPCRGCSRSPFSGDPGKPVKKSKKGRERTVQRPVTTATAKGREVQAGAEKPRFRAKVRVRRYRLLAEVISC